MKKILLVIFIGSLVSSLNAQISFSVLAPDIIEGGYDFTYADPNTWGCPDLSDPANAVMADLLLVDDGTISDSLGCAATTNSMVGKIALIYRGTCEFGTKSKYAQNAGALAVVLINNIPGPPIAMGPGVDGANVTIPVVMITDATGALIRARLDSDEIVNVFIGNKFGFYDNDLGFYSKHTLKAKSSATPSLIAQNENEFDVQPGSWVFNYGSNNQTGITLNAAVNFGGSDIYSETSSSFSLNSGDSLYVAFPLFSQTSYSQGIYNLKYTINYGIADEYPLDNSVANDFLISDNLLAIAEVDEAGMPLYSSGVRDAASTETFSACMVFRNQHASRLQANGLSFSASTATNTGISLEGDFIEINAYEWNDNFVDLNDANFDFTDVNLVTSGIYDFPSDQQGVQLYTPFDDPFVMNDNQRYLFCATTYNTDIFIGFDSRINYDQNENEFLQPILAIEADGVFSLGFTDPTYPAVVLQTEPSVIGLNENEKMNITAFPNPANNFITIPINGYSGTGILSVIDVAGKEVMNEKINLNNNKLKVNVSALSNGIYNFNLMLENGSKGSIKILVKK